MRNIYLLLILFLVACIVCAEIYIYQVRSIGFFQAPAISGALWLVELLLMLLVACFIGLAIGWQLRQGTISNLENEIYTHKQEKKRWIGKMQEAEEEANKIQSKLSRAQESFKEDFKIQVHEKERLKESIASLKTRLEVAKEESNQLQGRVDFKQEEFERTIENNTLLKIDLERAQAEVEHLRSGLSKPFTLPPKDDLKLIAGIGPALEKKLNGLGIYSFRQISELTPLAIDEITNAIKFFPGRIERDNWVSQARNFEEEKRRQVIS